MYKEQSTLVDAGRTHLTRMSKSVVFRVAIVTALTAVASCTPLLAQSQVVVGTGKIVLPRASRSSGVLTMVHAKDAFAHAKQMRLDPRPVVVYGGPDDSPEFDLTNVIEVALLSGDRMAALLVGRGVFLFGANGRGQQVLVRQGRGPGEVLSARMTSQGADTLLLVDRDNARITWLVPGKGVVRTESTNGRLPSLVSQPIGALRGGGLVLTSAGIQVSGRPTAPEARSTATVVYLAPGSSGVTVASLPDLQLRAVETKAGGKTTVEQDIVRLGLRLQVAIWDSMLVTGDGAKYALDLRSRTGKMIGRLEVNSPRRRVTKSMRDALIDAEVARLHKGGPGFRPVAETRQIMKSAPYADSLPAFRALFPTADGLLWVLDGGTSLEGAWSATAFRLDGAIVARVTATTRGTPVAFAPNRVLLKDVDTDGVVSYRLHRIVGGP